MWRWVLQHRHALVSTCISPGWTPTRDGCTCTYRGCTSRDAIDGANSSASGCAYSRVIDRRSTICTPGHASTATWQRGPWAQHMYVVHSQGENVSCSRAHGRHTVDKHRAGLGERGVTSTQLTCIRRAERPGWPRTETEDQRVAGKLGSSWPGNTAVSKSCCSQATGDLKFEPCNLVCGNRCL